MKTSNKQISLFTEDKSTYSQEDSLVNHIQQQENEKERMMKDIYGQRCCDAFRKFNHVGLWAKTFSDLLVGQGDWYSMRCNLIWKLKGTKYNRTYFQLQPKTLHTEEIESGLLLTPTVTDIGHRSDKSKQKRKVYRESIGRKTVPPGNLSEQVMGLLPTPTVVQDECNPDIWDERMKRIVAKGHNSFTVPLTQMAMRGMLPTPVVSDSKGSGNKESLIQRNRGENNDLSSWATINTDGKNAKLNPEFVAEMMGFPNKWTEKPFEEDSENSFDAVDFNDFPTSYPIVQEEYKPNDMTHSKWRRESIKGYGNAVVPQVVLEIFIAIDKYENLKQ